MEPPSTAATASKSQECKTLFTVQVPVMRLGYAIGVFPYKVNSFYPSGQLSAKGDEKLLTVVPVRSAGAFLLVALLGYCCYLVTKSTFGLVAALSPDGNVTLCQVSFCTALVLPCLGATITAICNVFAAKTFKRVLESVHVFPLDEEIFARARRKITVISYGLPCLLVLSFFVGYVVTVVLKVSVNSIVLCAIHHSILQIYISKICNSFAMNCGFVLFIYDSSRFESSYIK